MNEVLRIVNKALKMGYKTYEREELNIINDETLAGVFNEAYVNATEVLSKGKPADYIPELAKADAADFGIYMIDRSGKSISLGETEKRFSIQSISKVINLATALKFLGYTYTFSHVGMEPSGDAFNSIIKLDTASDIPYNPMINAGAIQTVSMLADEFDFEDLLAFARRFCMDDDIVLNEAVYRSEAATGDRNRSIAYLLKSKGVLMADPEKTLDLYFRMCSLNVNARDLANMGLIIANDGFDPFSKKHLISPDYMTAIKSVMFSCGLYDESGEFAVNVGLPAKSGVGGGIVAAAKGPMGIGTFGPALNQKGNSVGGIKALEHISHRLHLHVLHY